MTNPIFEKLVKDHATRSGFLNAFSTLSALLTEELFKKNKKTSELVEGVNQKNVNQLLEQTKALLDQTEELTITVAFTPNDNDILAISQYVRKNIGNGVMINLKTDPRLLAGAIISKNGFEKDYSWRKKLFEGRKEIADMIKSG